MLNFFSSLIESIYHLSYLSKSSNHWDDVNVNVKNKTAIAVLTVLKYFAWFIIVLISVILSVAAWF
jgi:hypothetical protein